MAPDRPADDQTSAPPAGTISLTVLLPAFNEERAVGAVISELRRALAEVVPDADILVVDDGSTDGTVAAAARQGARVARHVERGGYGAAVRTGLLAARGEWIALLDADGSYPAERLPDLLRHVPEYEQVNGARRNESGTHPLVRRAAKWTLRRLAEWISGKSIPDLNTGMKVFRRETALRYLWVIPDGFSCSTSLTMAFLCHGHAVKHVPIEYRPREGISKFRPIADTAAYALTIVRLMTYFRPLRVFLPLSAALGAAAALKGAFDAWTSPSGLSDSVVILATAAALVFALGLLADLIVARGRAV